MRVRSYHFFFDGSLFRIPTHNRFLQRTKPSHTMDSDSLASIIKQRQTWKVLAPVDEPINHSPEKLQTGDQKLTDSIATAGWAPFHYDRASDGIAEPWRVHVLNQDRCRGLAKKFSSLFSDIKPSNKLPSMLSACGALALVTWLPQFSHGAGTSGSDAGMEKEKQIQVDEEHLAAASAFVQNLLLLLTAEGLGSYWSSGGQFRSKQMFQHLQIPVEQRLLAAVFVDYAPERTPPERVAGKLRNNRSDVKQWKRDV